MELKKGMYVRTNDGFIVILTIPSYINGRKTWIYEGDYYKENLHEQDIYKSSYDITDLIKDGDFVNGESITLGNYDGHVFYRTNHGEIIDRSKVKNILTKEQYDRFSLMIKERINKMYETNYFLIINGKVKKYSSDFKEMLEELSKYELEIDYYGEISKEDILKQTYMDTHEGGTTFISNVFDSKTKNEKDIIILDENYIGDYHNDLFVMKAIAMWGIEYIKRGKKC